MATHSKITMVDSGLFKSYEFSSPGSCLRIPEVWTHGVSRTLPAAERWLCSLEWQVSLDVPKPLLTSIMINNYRNGLANS